MVPYPFGSIILVVAVSQTLVPTPPAPCPSLPMAAASSSSADIPALAPDIPTYTEEVQTAMLTHLREKHKVQLKAFRDEEEKRFALLEEDLHDRQEQEEECMKELFEPPPLPKKAKVNAAASNTKDNTSGVMISPTGAYCLFKSTPTPSFADVMKALTSERLSA